MHHQKKEPSIFFRITTDSLCSKKAEEISTPGYSTAENAIIVFHFISTTTITDLAFILLSVSAINYHKMGLN